MKLAVLLCGVVAIALVGGFAYVSVADVSVPTATVTKTISNEQFFNAPSN